MHQHGAVEISRRPTSQVLLRVSCTTAEPGDHPAMLKTTIRIKQLGANRSNFWSNGMAHHFL